MKKIALLALFVFAGFGCSSDYPCVGDARNVYTTTPERAVVMAKLVEKGPLTEHDLAAIADEGVQTGDTVFHGNERVRQTGETKTIDGHEVVAIMVEGDDSVWWTYPAAIECGGK